MLEGSTEDDRDREREKARNSLSTRYKTGKKKKIQSQVNYPEGGEHQRLCTKQLREGKETAVDSSKRPSDRKAMRYVAAPAPFIKAASTH